MNRNLTGLMVGLAALVAFWLGGCNKANNSGATKPGETAAHDHEHDHVHNGPHHGHLMELGEEEYHAEWTHDESGKVTFYILDAEAKKEVPVSADEIVIDVKVGNNPSKSYELTAVNPLDGKASAFEIVDKPFESLFDQ